jgi:hypothetical protein
LAFRSGILRRCRFGMLVLFFIGACAPVKESYRYLDEGENHVVRLEKAGAAASYSHPADLDPAVLEKALRSVVVSHPVPLLKRIFIQKSEVVGPAFTPEEAALLAGRFKAAAERAMPEEHIAFLLASDKNHLSTEITSGIAFLKEGKLHLIFANHHAPLSAQRHPQIPRDTMLRSYEQDGFQLIVQPHQIKVGDGLLERGQEGISIDYAAFGTEAPPDPNEKGALEAAALGSLKLEERFQLLKKLREEGLITEEEYTGKKKDLLKRLDIK